MKLRVINAGITSPLYSQAIYHGIAGQMQAKDDPVLVLVQPDKPYVCIGLHQKLKGEIDVEYCAQNNIDVIRRHIGGGAVLLDTDQLFFHYIFPKEKAPNQPSLLYPYLLQPVLHTYHHFGIPASLKSLNDIHVINKKIGGTGAGSINNATVLVGSFLFDFNYHLMAQCVHAESPLFRNAFKSILEENITTIKAQITDVPSIENVVNVFSENTEKLLEVSLIRSTLTPRETEAISLAENELMDDEWLNIESNKLVSNGLKVSAGVYLLEQNTNFCDSLLTIRMKYENKSIHTLWLESETPRIQASLIFICTDINTAKPSIDFDSIYEITLKATSKLSVIDEENTAFLTQAIYALGNINEY